MNPFTTGTGTYALTLGDAGVPVSFVSSGAGVDNGGNDGPCLVHRDCHDSERCLVIPKADGFASEGECVDPCGDDLQCPAQQRCEPFAENGSHLSPASAADAGACRAGARR